MGSNKRTHGEQIGNTLVPMLGTLVGTCRLTKPRILWIPLSPHHSPWWTNTNIGTSRGWITRLALGGFCWSANFCHLVIATPLIIVVVNSTIVHVAHCLPHHHALHFSLLFWTPTAKTMSMFIVFNTMIKFWHHHQGLPHPNIIACL